MRSKSLKEFTINFLLRIAIVSQATFVISRISAVSCSSGQVPSQCEDFLCDVM